MDSELVAVARIGKSFGVSGEVVLHVVSDFPQSLQSGREYRCKRGLLTLDRFANGRAKFAQIDSKEAAKAYANLMLYATQEQTKEWCKLSAGEFFYFDIIGAEVVENGETLGVVCDIDRFCGADHLCVRTDAKLANSGLPKTFLLPYTDRYILKVEDIKTNSQELGLNNAQNAAVVDKSLTIHTKNARDILENS